MEIPDDHPDVCCHRLAVLIAIVPSLLVMRPDTFRVQRSIDINAPADKIFPLINDYRNWGSWSPYEHVDPDMQRTFSGAPSGKGSIYEWRGNKNIGHGGWKFSMPRRRRRSSSSWISSARSKPQHGRVHHAAQGRHDKCNLGDARSGAVHGEDHSHVHEHGPHGWRPVSAGTGQHEGCRGEVTE
jgi:hypothetical protein